MVRGPDGRGGRPDPDEAIDYIRTRVAGRDHPGPETCSELRRDSSSHRQSILAEPFGGPSRFRYPIIFALECVERIGKA
jgi:hypothetical protein